MGLGLILTAVFLILFGIAGLGARLGLVVPVMASVAGIVLLVEFAQTTGRF